ncbi:proliferation marker protein Ki-67 isoform X2 [Patagioenas fasciata]|uniref:proliferation marker protein Ki-67 isoform X2 n=1 Tax=Patagioenas fasciata TaxID=372321 RepID=UPI0032E8645F
MPLFGNIIVIKRNGTDGIAFPLTASSCLFGRRTECDIRIQLPQVSKEHCKIEVNENKEAILTNLSTVNPTQLNGGCFQQPVPLKHGDVLTIIDRSFRFEYPLQSTPRKKRSRSPKAETLQVLHVQQVAEVELSRKQTSGSKSLPASDNGECEGKHGNENKQNTEENISKSVPIKPQTPKSSHRIHQSIGKQNEQSPFSELCEKLRREITVKKPLHKGNESPKAAKEDGRRVLPEPGAQISSSTCVYDLGSQNEKELGRSENVEECKRKVEPDVICSELNRISAAGSAARKSFTRSPRISGSKEVSRTTGKRSDVQDHREPSTAGRSKDTEITPKASKEKDGNAAFSWQLCTIQRLDYPDKIPSSAVVFGKPAPTTNTANVSGVDKCVLSTPTSRRKSLQSQFISPTKETSGENPVNADTPIRRGASLKPESVSEISTETQREDLVWRSESPKQLPLTENKCLKQRRNSKQRTPGKLVQGEVPKEIYDQANAVNSKEECPETPASYRNSKSPRRNNRQSQELSNKSFHSEKLAWEGLTPELASPASQKSGSGRKRSRARRSSGLQTGEALEANAGQEHHDTITDRKDSGTKEEAVAKGGLQRQDSEDAGVTGRRRLSSKRRSSGSVAVPKDNAAASEMSISGLLAGEGSGQMKSISQKRKSADLLLHPLGKRKRVSFGGHLSPELFDKSLPPNSPLKRGATPARRSVPFGNSPRAVLKKSQGSKLFVAQELSEHSQKEKMSPKNLPNQKSPTASSPVSGKATPTFTLNSPATYTKGRFSICCITAPLPIAEEKDAVADDVNTKGKNGAQVKTPKSSPINQHDKSILKATPDKLTRSAQLALKVTPLKRRSGAVAIINAKRRSGASSANLLVAKSWAEVVKLGVARPQSKTVKKSVRKGRSVKKITKSPKTPERKIKSHFSTGHAESPATIVVGRAYSTTVRTAGRVPKVIKNPVLKLNMNMDESFTGMTELFQTPEDKSGKALPLATVQKADFTPTGTAMEMSDLHTPEETGEMMVSPLNNSDASEQKQDSPGFCHFLREKSLKSVFDAIAIKTPEKGKAVLEENNSVDSLTIPDEHVSRVKSGRKRRTPKQKLEPVEALSGIKELMKTPKQRPEPVEALSGIKELMKTPKQRPEPVEALSGIKELMKTPKQRPEPVEALSGIKELMKTPKQRSEPVVVLSGIKELMKTPKQRSEPVVVLSGIKELMKTPKQRSEPVETLSGIKELMKTPKQRSEPVVVLSGIKELMKTPKQRSEPAETLLGVKELMKTPKQRPEPVEALSGIKELMKTPKQTSEPVEPLSGIKYLLRTPKQKSEPVEVLSGIKRLMRTPQQKAEPVEVLSGIKKLMETPQQELEPVTDATAFRRLLKTPKEAGKAVGGVTLTEKTPKLKYQPVEDMIGVSRLFKTPKENVEPIEDVFGISRLVKTPKEKSQPVDDFVGLQRLMAEPRQKSSNFEVDYVGVTEMFDTPEEMKVKSVNVMDSKEEDTAPPCIDSSDQNDKGNISQGEASQQKESTSEKQPTQRPRGRPRKTVPPASARQREKSLNVKELQGLEKTPTQEETEETSTSASAPKNKGRGRRAKDCIQEEIGSTLPEQEKVETVSFVEPHGIAPRPARGKRKEPKELKASSENLESSGKNSSVLRNEPANMKQILQEYGISDIAETEDAPTVNTISVSGSTQHENGQLQTGLKKAENESNEGGGEDSEEIFLSPGKRSRGVKKVENTDPLIPPKRGRRAKNDQVKQAASEDVRGTRRLCKDPSTKVMQKDEQTFDKDAETATTEESENRAELEIKTTEKRVMSLRSDRKHSAEAKADVCETALENTQTVEKTQETSAKTDSETQSHLKNEIEVSQEDEAANAQENITEASRRLKAASPSGGTKEILVTALNLEANRSAGGETNRTRKRRGKNDLLDKKTVNNLEVITPKFKSETEMDESSLKDSLGSACVKNPHQVTKDQGDPTGTSIPAANGDSLARGHQKRTRSEQKILKTNQTDILQENQAENHGMACKRGRKVQFVLEEASSKAVGDESSPEDGKGMTYKDNQHQTSENPSSQVRRSRRKQVDSMPPIACPTFMEKQTSIADQSQGEALVKEQDSALGAAPSSTEEQPLRRGKRREVAAAPTSTSLPIRRRRGLLEGDDRKTTMREDQNPALGNQTLQAKANASARGRRKKIDAVAEVKSSSLLQEQCGLSETGDKEESTNEEQNVPLETVSCAKEKPLGRGRRKGTALASQTTNYISLRGKSGLPADSGREETPKEDQNVPLESSDSSVKENQPRKGRRKEDVILLEATSSAQEKQGLSKASGRKSNREAKKLNLENSVSQEKMDLSKGNSGQTTTSLADSSTSLQGLPEDGKKETPEEPQNVLLEAAPSAKENPSRAGRKKAISSKSEETSSAYLREKPALPQERPRKRILQESEDASLENNSAQEKTRQLRNKRKKVEFQAEAATLISIHKNSDLPENDGASETQNVRLASTRSEKDLQPGEGTKGISPGQAAAATSRRRKLPFPAEDLASKKPKSEKDANGALQKGKRNQTREEPGEGAAKAARAAGGTDRRTRSSVRTRK